MAGTQAGNVWFAFSNKVVDGMGPLRSIRVSRRPARRLKKIRWRLRATMFGWAARAESSSFARPILRDALERSQSPGRVSGIVETEAGDVWVNGFSGIRHVNAADLKGWIQDPVRGFRRAPRRTGWPARPLGRGAAGAPRWWKAQRPVVVCDHPGIAWLDPAALKPIEIDCRRP